MTTAKEKEDLEQDKMWAQVLFDEHGICVEDIADKLERAVGTVRRWVYGSMSLKSRVLYYFEKQAPNLKITAQDIACEVGAKQTETKKMLRALAKDGWINMTRQTVASSSGELEYFSYAAS